MTNYRKHTEDDLPILKGLLQYGTAPEYMSVRFGRVPKREKARIIAAMHSVQSRSLERSLLAELDDESIARSSIIQAYLDTCEFTQENNRQLRSHALSQPLFVPDPNSTSCPLFPTTETIANSSSTFTMRFSRAIRGVINFSLRLPIFSQIPTEDRMLLLKAGAFEALLVCLAGLFESETNTFLCMNGKLIRKESMYNSSNTRFLMDSMCDYAERMNRLQLVDSELALFTAVVIVAPDRPGLRHKELIDRIHKRFSTFLQNELAKNHPDQPNLYRELISFIPDLRTLNALHSDKYFCQRKSVQPISSQNGYYDDCRTMWDDKETNVNSPSSTCSADEAMRSPESLSGESSGSSEGSVCGSEVSTYMELTASFTQHRQKREPSESSSSGDEALDSYGNGKCPFMKRKVESPNDSGIEIDKISLPSICSSPRSSIDEKIEEDREEDMPVLRRALQAPPIMNTDLIMEEAYKPHKKFRALRREEEPHSSLSHSSSILAHTLSQPSSSSSSLLASALAAPSLAKTLSEQPKMSEDLLRRADMIHSLMVKKESLCQRSQKRHNRASPVPHYVNHSVKERLQPPSPTWCSSANRNGISSSVPEPHHNQRNIHLLTTPTPSRYYEPSRRSVTITSSSMGGCQSSMSPPRSPNSSLSYGEPSSSSCSTRPSIMELQVDISDSQPLNLSKKTPPPSHSFLVEA